MFTLNQIKDAHAKVRSGADFPQYIRDLETLGVCKYIIYVADGHAEYVGKADCRILSASEYPTLEIAEMVDMDRFRNDLKIHQKGETDYFTFCRHSAAAGVEKWVVDIKNRSCTYFGKSDMVICVEQIPI